MNIILVTGMVLFTASTSRADVPAPPVNQSIGMSDVAIGDMMEAGCRVCHATGVPDRHHLLLGSSFTNITNFIRCESDVTLTAADESSLILTPDVMNQGSLTVTIPGDTAPGNYDLRAIKAGVASNPVAISIIPEVIVTGATGNGKVTINGSGFGGYATGSGTSVTGIVATGKGRSMTIATVEAAIVSWSETVIEADFDSRPNEVTVNAVFGSATSEVGNSKPGRGKGRKK